MSVLWQDHNTWVIYQLLQTENLVEIGVDTVKNTITLCRIFPMTLGKTLQINAGVH